MTHTQLIQSIEQQLENLMALDDDLAYQYECELYYENEEPIQEQFTPELLTELTDLVYQLDHGFLSSEELKELDDSDLSFEISDATIINTPQADEYLSLLIQELQRRNATD